jgi:hypothetical protein
VDGRKRGCGQVRSRSMIARSAPLAKRACAIARPRPWAPPVITATFPSREKDLRLLCLCCPFRSFINSARGVSILAAIVDLGAVCWNANGLVLEGIVCVRERREFVAFAVRLRREILAGENMHFMIFQERENM